MKFSRKQKIMRAVPGFVVGAFMVGIIIWGVSSDNKCKKLLKKENRIQQIVFSYYSKEHMVGSGSKAVSTGFYINYKGEKYKATTKKILRPIADNTPILISYSPESLSCYEFLWDSIIMYNNLKYEYFYIEGKGYDLRLCNLQ